MNSPNKDCIFCLTPVNKKQIQYQGCKCVLFFHDSCINEWFRQNPNSCPLCRKQVSVLENDTKKEIEKEDVVGLGCLCWCMICPLFFECFE